MDWLDLTKHKPNDEPVVIAVATHSNFMNEGEIQAKCKEHYPVNRKGQKANNNQVVMLNYKLESVTSMPQQGEQCSDLTEDYRLVSWPSGDARPSCQAVAGGSSLFDEDGGHVDLCHRDIGTHCEDQIEVSGPGLQALRPFLEQKFALERAQEVRRKAELAATRAALQKLEASAGGGSDKDLKRLEQQRKQLQQTLTDISERSAGLGATRCFDGNTLRHNLSQHGNTFELAGKKSVDLRGISHKCCCSSDVLSNVAASTKVVCALVPASSTGCGSLLGDGFHSWNNMPKKYSRLANYGKCFVEQHDL